MPLPVSPKSISAGQIAAEFGRKNSAGWSINDYRKVTNIGGASWPVDEGIPFATGPDDTTTAIKFSDFYGKQHNIIILMEGGDAIRQEIIKHCTSKKSTAYRETNPSTRKTSKNIVYIIKKIGSTNDTSLAGDIKKYCALRTQTNSKWFGGDPKDAKVIIRVGPTGALYGAGGDGGRGGKYDRNGDDGGDGSSALGIQVDVESVIVEPGGIIQAGGGGGGGGGGGKEGENPMRKGGGGGGGGGAGYPAGIRGGLHPSGTKIPGNDDEHFIILPTKGSGGVLQHGGAGGDGCNNDNEARGGGGGGGGTYNPTASGGPGGNSGGGSSGDGGDGSDSNGEGGEGGAGRGEGQSKESEGGSRGEGGYAITREGYVSQAPSVSGNVYGPVGQHGVR